MRCLPPGTLAAGCTWYTQGNSSIARNKITSIAIVDTYDTTGKNIVDQWDASTESTGSSDNEGTITAYVEDDGTGDGTYKLTLAGNGTGKIMANKNSESAFGAVWKSDTYANAWSDVRYREDDFSGFWSVADATGFDLLDTSNVTNMGFMFSNFGAHKQYPWIDAGLTLDVSTFNVSKVTNMEGMFARFSWDHISLFAVPESTPVTDIGGMFFATYLKDLDLSEFHMRELSAPTSNWACFGDGSYHMQTIVLNGTFGTNSSTMVTFNREDVNSNCYVQPLNWDANTTVYGAQGLMVLSDEENDGTHTPWIRHIVTYMDTP